MYLWSALVSLSGLAIGLINGRVIIGLILLGVVSLFLVTALPRFTERTNGDGDGHAAQEAGPGSPRPPEPERPVRGTAPPT
jgi:hypothetical protein